MSTRQRVITDAAVSVIALACGVIMPREGKRNETYLDPTKIPTACYGHTGADVRIGAHYDDAHCVEWLKQDALQAYIDVMRCVKRPLAAYQAAFVSFAYNVGGDKFCGSTMARKANAGDLAGACAELSRWTLAGGKALPGLVTRREKERVLCEGRS